MNVIKHKHENWCKQPSLKATTEQGHLGLRMENDDCSSTDYASSTMFKDFQVLSIESTWISSWKSFVSKKLTDYIYK